MESCVQMEYAVGGGALHGYFREQELPIGVQKCLERFHRRCLDYLSQLFTPKWNSPNAKSVLVTVSKTSLLVELTRVAM